MRAFAGVGLAGLILLFAPPAHAQGPGGLFGEVAVGLALKDVPTGSFGPDQGFQAAARLGLAVDRHLGVLGEISLATFPQELVNTPGGSFVVNRVTLAGVALGLQPRFSAGPIKVLLSGTAGKYWLYHRSSGPPESSSGLGGRLGVVFPIGRHIQPLLEGSLVALLRSGITPHRLGHVGFGVALH